MVSFPSLPPDIRPRRGSRDKEKKKKKPTIALLRLHLLRILLRAITPHIVNGGLRPWRSGEPTRQHGCKMRSGTGCCGLIEMGERRLRLRKGREKKKNVTWGCGGSFPMTQLRGVRPGDLINMTDARNGRM